MARRQYSGSASAMLLGVHPLDVAASGNTEVVRNLGIEDILVTLSSRYHLIRLPERDQDLSLCIALGKERLKRYQYPHLVEFVDDLPKTVTGKIQRFKLRQPEPNVSMPQQEDELA